MTWSPARAWALPFAPAPSARAAVWDVAGAPASVGRRGSPDVQRARATRPSRAVRAARRGAVRNRPGDVLDHLLPALVPAGALERPLPEAGAEQPGPRRHGPGAARRDPRPQRQGPGRQPHRSRSPDPADGAPAE